jgi:hypothetical protein
MDILARARLESPISLTERFGSPAIWFAFLGGPLAWTAHFLATYGLVYVACATGFPFLLYLPTLVAVPVVIASAIAARRLWQRPLLDAGTSWRTETRTRFFGLAGMVMNAIFLLAILFQGALPLFLNTCGGGP